MSNRQKMGVFFAVFYLFWVGPVVKSVYSVDIGSAFPIANSSEREQSVSVAFGSTNFLVGIQGDEWGHANVSAQLVSQTGSLESSVIPVSRTGGVPLVAYDGANYLLVWQDDATDPNDDIYGQFVDTSGNLVGSPFPISQAAHEQNPFGIAFDGTNYLVVWEDFRGTSTDIYGQFVTPSGMLHGSEIPICTSIEEQRYPNVAFNGTAYLVAWVSKRTGFDGLWDVQGSFITTAGDPSAIFDISVTGTFSPNHLDIAFDGTNYLVVWNKDIDPGYPVPQLWDILGRLVIPSGGFLGGEFLISDASGNQIYPFVTFDGTNYWVTWTDQRNDTSNYWVCDPDEGTCTDIYGQIVSPAGSLVGSEFPIIELAGEQVGSAFAFDGTKFLVAWNTGGTFPFDSSTDWDVFGVFMGLESSCNGDFNNDGDVDGSDLAMFAADFGRTNCGSQQPPCEGDFDGDGDVDGTDLATFAADFGRTDCP